MKKITLFLFLAVFFQSCTLLKKTQKYNNFNNLKASFVNYFNVNNIPLSEYEFINTYLNEIEEIQLLGAKGLGGDMPFLFKFKEKVENDTLHNLNVNINLPKDFFADKTNVFQSEPITWLQASHLIEGVNIHEPWMDKSLNYFLKRAMPINDLIEGMSKLSADKFKDLLTFHNPKNFKIKFGVGYRNLNFNEKQYLKCLRSKSSLRESPPKVGSIMPTEACVMSGVTIKLTPEQNEKFPVEQPSNLSIYAGDKKLNIITWNEDYIEVFIPPNSTSGCLDLNWVLTYSGPNRIDFSDGCAPSLLLPGSKKIFGISYSDIALIGEPQIDVWIDNKIYEKPIDIESCREVTLNWDVKVPSCWPKNSVEIQVKSSNTCADWLNKITYLKSPHSFSLNEKDNRVYEFVVKVKNRTGSECATFVKSIAINRKEKPARLDSKSIKYYINLSYKIILDPRTGKRPNCLTDEQIICSVKHMNQVCRDLNTSFRFQLTESPIEIGGINKSLSKRFYDFVPDSIRSLEAQAKQNLSEYAWKNNAINLYFAGVGWGGYCSFPSDGEIIALANDAGGLANIHLHEIGHYFDLLHTHALGGVCSKDAGGIKSDDVSDTIEDDMCFSINDLSLHNFNKLYVELNSRQKELVNNTWGNIMSYHDSKFIKRILTKGQIQRWENSMLTTRKNTITLR